MGKFGGKEEYHDIYPEFNEPREPLIRHKERSAAEILLTAALAGTLALAAVGLPAIAKAVFRPVLQSVTETTATVEVTTDIKDTGLDYPLSYQLYPYDGEKTPADEGSRLLLTQEEVSLLGSAEREGELNQAREILVFEELTSGGTYLLVFPDPEDDTGKTVREEAVFIRLTGRGETEGEPSVTDPVIPPAVSNTETPTPTCRRFHPTARMTRG